MHNMEQVSATFAACLAVDVPAEQVMFDQHVLHSLFQWLLLLLLGHKRNVESF